jgi:hypothetical protein
LPSGCRVKKTRPVVETAMFPADSRDRRPSRGRSRELRRTGAVLHAGSAAQREPERDGREHEQDPESDQESTHADPMPGAPRAVNVPPRLTAGRRPLHLHPWRRGDGYDGG